MTRHRLCFTFAVILCACSKAETAPPSGVLQSDTSVSETTRTTGATDTSDTSDASDGSEASDGDAADALNAAEDATDGDALEAESEVAIDAFSDVVVVPSDADVAGTFLVLRIGDGQTTTIDESTTQAVFLEQRQIGDGTLVQTTNLPTVAAGAQFPLTLSGGLCEGSLTLSPDKAYVTFAGYNLVTGTTIAGEKSITVASVDATMAIDTSTVDTWSTGSFGQACSAVRNGNDVWLGTNAYVDYAVFGTSASISDAGPDAAIDVVHNVGTYGQGLQIIGNQLYGTLGAQLDFAGATLPKTTGINWTSVMRGTSPYDFLYVSRNRTVPGNVLYIADPNAGLQRWAYNATTTSWALNATLDTQGYVHVTGFMNSDSTVTLIAVTGDGAHINRFIDDGVATRVPYLTLATVQGHAMQDFLGVSLPPQ